ncbi:carbonic anhydrase 4-like [Spea bombifrons]|uniref:carbonic anhydrase 4-like n=1 Tax=Spea bombifrons TaxID=233779 RepID=UPI00234BC13B|nr:carbonic anhydrase 4-like [Spea bombifrons]XP_053310779.1 carbonic anhydrase 4-like [Spea bombifrons]
MKSLSVVLFLSLHFIKLRAGEWCYEPEACNDCSGPNNWGHISSKCDGSAQSPINIVTHKLVYNKQLNPFTFEGYDSAHDYTITNNGHSVEVNLKSSSIQIQGGGLPGHFKAIQLHFHWGSDKVNGSEHSIDGERFPMELHIVHSNAAGKSVSNTTSDDRLAVLGFFYEPSNEENKNYTSLIEAIKKIPQAGSTTTVSNLNLQKLIPESRYLKHYYRYNGSLTTPTCDEKVTWTLFPQTIKLAKEQLKVFYEQLNFSATAKMERNFRPIQNLNNRIVETSDARSIFSQTAVLLTSLFLCYLMNAS